MLMVPTGPDLKLCLSPAKLLLASGQDTAENPAYIQAEISKDGPGFE